MVDQSPPLPNTDEAIEFLIKWDTQGPRTLVAIRPTKEKGEEAHVRARSFAIGEEEIMRKWIDEYNGQWNLYFVPNRCNSNVTTTPKKPQMRFMRCFHLDLDLPKDAEHTEAVLAELLQRIQSFDPAPHVIIFSGGGYQCFWLFDTERACEDWLERVEECNKAILKQVNGDGSCFNANRIMRLPGTVNVLNYLKRSRGRSPAMAHVVAQNWDAPRWSFEHDAMPRVPEREPVPETIEPQEGIDAKTQTVEDLPAKLQKAVKNGDASTHGGDRSKLVWYITCSLVRLGWDDDNIEALLLNKALRCTDHIYDQSNPQQYAGLQVKKAKEAVATDWRRNDKGQIVTTDEGNIRKALAAIGVRVGFNMFEGKSYVNGYGPLRPLEDIVVKNIRSKINGDCGFLPNKELLFDTIDVIADANRYDPVFDWHAKNEPKWDGEARIDTWLIKYGGAEDNAFNRMAGRLTLIAGVRRVRQPGCKHDEMLVLVSKQGTAKSTALSVLAVKHDWFTDNFPLHSKDKEIIEHLQGRWIVECGELAGMRQAQIEEIKVLLSKQRDTARMAYAHLPVTVERRCIFIGSTNATEFLRDIENRRFWPVRITRFDTNALQEDVAQLWAEAAHYESAGESIQLPEEYWPLAAAAQEDHEQEEPWVTAIGDALGDLEGRITSEELWKVIGRPLERRLAVDAARLGDAMRKLGWLRKQFKIGGRPIRCYYKGIKMTPLYASPADPANLDAGYIIVEAPNSAEYESARDMDGPPPVSETPPF